MINLDREEENVEGFREIEITVFRYNSQKSDDTAEYQTYKLVETPGMTLYIALIKIWSTMDHHLSFDFVCRAGICGSCSMVVNGKPRLACKTRTSEFEDGKITLLPLPTFKHIKDLSVDTGNWMNAMSVKVESWIQTKEETDIVALEKPVEPDVAQAVFELDRCIECGICLASCSTKIMRDDFVGAVGLNRTARFAIDPHDER
ncbi:MAG TPA: fumarate reductase iron-sulfur subunit, partial [Sulfurovum sp.]|nr:fumarate reductase iron-sulfur subunit [Sulfurovum sp.]